MHDLQTLAALNAAPAPVAPVSLYTALSLVNGFGRSTEEERIAAWQYLIDFGAVWTLPGTYGRTAQDLINAGLCTVPGDHVAA